MQRVQFPPGATGTTIADRTYPGQIKRYLVNARRGQVLSVRVLNGSVTLDIRYPGGRVVQGGSNVLSWESELPRGGDYKIDVIATQDTNYQLDLNIRDLVQRSDQGTGNTGNGWWTGRWVNGWFGRWNGFQS